MLLECSCVCKGHRDIVFIGEEMGESQREGEGGREKERERESQCYYFYYHWVSQALFWNHNITPT